MGKVGSSYSYNVECQVCGFKYKSSDIRKRWDGKFVCKYDWEPRHPIDFFRPRNDTHKLPIILPRLEKKRVQVSVSADVTPTTGAWTQLQLNEELVDQASEYNTGTFTYQPVVTASRTFNFRYTLNQTSGSSSLRIALYKNGAAIKTIGPIYSFGPGETSIGGMYIDSAATTSDTYRVYYFITTTNGVIKAYDLSTCLEVT